MESADCPTPHDDGSLDDHSPGEKWFGEEERVLIEEREHHLNVDAAPKNRTFGVALVYLQSFIYLAPTGQL